MRNLLQDHSIQLFLVRVYILRVQHFVVCIINLMKAFHPVTQDVWSLKGEHSTEGASGDGIGAFRLSLTNVLVMGLDDVG